MKIQNKIFQRVAVLIALIILIIPVTGTQASTVSVLLENTVQNDYQRTNDFSNDSGQAGAFLDLAAPDGSYYTGIARTRGTANLASGSLHAYALAHSSSRATAYAEARFNDVLTFTPDAGAGWTGNDWVYANITMHVHAIKSEFTGVPGAPSGNFAELGYWGGGLGGNDGEIIGFNEVNGMTQVDQTLTLHNIAVYHPLRPEGERIHLTGALRAWVNASQFYQDKIDGEYYGQFDASNTAVISIDVPEGIGFTSESGVFLTSPVPVPSTLWLLGSGIIGLIGIRRKNSRDK